MEVQVTVLKEQVLDKKYRLVLPHTFVQEQIKDFLRKKSPQTKQSGFRPGKLPLKTLFSSYKKEGINHAVEQGIAQVFTEISEGKTLASLRYILETDLSSVLLDDIPDLSVEVWCAFSPSIEELTWSSLSLINYTPSITDEEIEKWIEKKASETMTSLPLEEKRPAQKGDTLLYVMTYKSSDGSMKEIEGAFRLGEGLLPKEFEEALEGVSEGHTVDERLRVPREFPDKELAGKKVAFSIFFKEIQKTVPHVVNDDFARSQGAEDLKDYRQQVKDLLTQEGETLASLIKRQDLRKKMKDFLTFPLPDLLIEDAYEGMIKKEKWRLVAENEREEAFIKNTGLSEEAYTDKLRKEAEKMVRSYLLIEKVIKDQSIKVEQKEMASYIYAISRQSQTPVDDIIAFLRKNPEKAEGISQEILERKALDWISDQCQSVSQEASLTTLRDHLKETSL